MEKLQVQLETLFETLNQRIDAMNVERRAEGLPALPKAKLQLLGQMSLLANEKVSQVLSLAQTGDLDAYLSMENVVKLEFQKLLKPLGLIYDEDSYLIWIPDGAQFSVLFDFEHVLVEVIDAESALVSKAVKAPEKNKQLIREAIASEEFPTLVQRILKHGGELENFV